MLQLPKKRALGGGQRSIRTRRLAIGLYLDLGRRQRDREVRLIWEPAQGQLVEPVNFNPPGQTVIAGHREAVERAIAAAKAKGAKRGVLLPVSAPFHSSLLKAAAERLAAYLVNVPISTPRIRVLHNVDARPAETPEAIRSALAKQAASPVRWVQTVQAFVTEGVTHIVECGPGQVFTGLCKRIAADVTVMPLADSRAIDAASGALK